MIVKRTRELDALGQSRKVRARLIRSGELVPIRHGAYADAPPAGALERHRQLIAGTVPLLGPDAVLSHVSAAVLHGLPSWEVMLGKVTVVRQSSGHGSKRRILHVRSGRLVPEDVVTLGGFPVTRLERTAIDLASCLDFERAVAVLDSALHRGGDKLLMAGILAASAGRRGVATVRAALAFADGRSESVGESVSRVRMAEAGVPAPRLQLNIFDASGVFVARSDFGWEEKGVLGEFDGRIKYLGTPEEVARTVMREKQREDRLRELGWVVARWEWADLDPSTLRRRIEAAFAQGRPDSLRGHVEAT